jgi:hypothetical protein
MSFNGAVAPWGRYREFHGFQVAPQRVCKLSQEAEMRSARRLDPGTQLVSVAISAWLETGERTDVTGEPSGKMPPQARSATRTRHLPERRIRSDRRPDQALVVQKQGRATIARWSPARFRSSPRRPAECDPDGAVRRPPGIARIALACISGAALRSASISLLLLGERPPSESAVFAVDLQLLKVALHRLTQIRNQMVAVGELNRRRRALPPSIGIQTGPIASDHLDLRM